jgi:GAF domain-containing protein
MAVAVAVIGWTVRSAARGLLPIPVRVPLAVITVVVVCILVLVGLVVGARSRPEVIEKHDTDDRRASIWNQVAAATQWIADLAAARGQPDRVEKAYRVLDKLFYCVPQALAASSQYHRIALFVLDQKVAETAQLLISREVGFESEVYVSKLRLPVQGSIAGLVYRTRRSYRTGDVLNDENWLKVEDDPQKYRSLMCAPVIAADEILGVLSIDSTETDAFTEEDELSLGIFARQVAVILTLAKQEEVAGAVEKGE